MQRFFDEVQPQRCLARACGVCVCLTRAGAQVLPYKLQFIENYAKNAQVNVMVVIACCTSGGC
jgi:hypothetical protein